MSDYVPVHKQRKMFGFYLLKKVSIHRRIQFKYRSMKYTIYLIAKYYNVVSVAAGEKTRLYKAIFQATFMTKSASEYLFCMKN
jgi:hypothetical protein